MQRTEKGFTLVELLVVLVLLGLATTIGVPLLQNFLNRAKVEGSMRATMIVFRNARYEAIKRSREIHVQGHLNENWIDIYFDADADNVWDPGEEVQPRYFLEYPVTFQGPAADSDPVIGFDETSTPNTFIVRFQNDGSVESEGSVRIGDDRGNFIQIDISPAATAKLSLAKWYEPENDWLEWGREDVAWKWY